MQKLQRITLAVAVLLLLMSLTLVSNVPTVTIAQEGEPAKQVIPVEIHIVPGSGITEASIRGWLELAGDVWGCSFIFNVTAVNNHTAYNNTANGANVTNIWALPTNPFVPPAYGNTSSATPNGNRVTLVPGDGTNRYIKNSTLAHEIGHIFGLPHNLTDSDNLMHPDIRGGKSCNRTGTNVTDPQQQSARNSTQARAQEAGDMGHGTSQWDTYGDTPCHFADLAYTQVWATFDEIYLTLTVADFTFEDIIFGMSWLGFYLETDNDPTTGCPDEGVDYYVGLSLVYEGGMHYEEVIFERIDEEYRVPLDPMGITYEWVYEVCDADCPPIITGVQFILPIDELERKAGHLLSFRATGECYEFIEFIDKCPDEGLHTIFYVPEEYNLTISSTAGGLVTTPGEGTLTYAPQTVVDLVAEAEEGYQFVNWTGDVGTIADADAATTTITMDNSYSIRANFEESDGCFIATAAYGTPMAEEIEILREFRDGYLLTNPVGKGLVEFYYRVSPPMAEFIAEHPSLKPIVRAGLLPAVAMSAVAVNTTPTEKTAIIGLLTLVSVALAVWATRRRGRGPEYT